MPKRRLAKGGVEEGGRKQVKTEQAPPSHVSTLSSYLSIDHAQVNALHQFVHSEPLLPMVMDIATSALLGGGILFHRQDMYLRSHEADVHSRMWSVFVRRMLHTVWTYGFAGVIFERRGRDTVPRVLDLTMVDVRVRKRETGDVEYVFIRRPEDRIMNHVMGKVHGLEEPIPNVIVIEFHAPDRQGNLNSKVRSLMQRKVLVDTMLRAEVRAVNRLSNPVMVVQENGVAKEEPAIVSDLGLSSTGAGVNHRDSNSVESKREDEMRREFVRSYNSGKLQEIIDTMQASRSRTCQSNGLGVPEVIVAPSMQLARHVPAAEPSHLMDIIRSFEEIVGCTFGVPRPMFGQFSATRSSNGPEAMRMFNDFQRGLKQLLVPILESLVQHAYRDAWAAEEAARWQAQHLTDAALQESRDRMKVRVSLPGIPPLDVLERWYDQGVLKYSAYRAFLAKAYGLAEDAFENAPRDPLEIRVKEASPPPPPVAPKPSSSNKKTEKRVEK